MKKTVYFRSKEYGTIVDELSCLLIMLFMTMLILVYAAYGKTVQYRLNIDNIAKSHLNQMEQNGYLDMNSLRSDMAKIGVTLVEGTWSNSTTSQVKYGDVVTITGDVSFANPLYDIMNKKDGKPKDIMFFVKVPSTISYHVKMSATAKY